MRHFKADLAFLMVLSGCGGNFEIQSTTATSSSSTALQAGETEPAVRAIFKHDYFSDLNDYVSLLSSTSTTSYQCVGDLTQAFYVNGDDYSGTATPLPTPTTSDFFNPTRKPAFVKNISVDVTRSYYPETEADVLLSDLCSFRNNVTAALPSTCADFDVTPSAAPAPTIPPTPTPSPVPVPAATPTTNQYFNTGFYRVRDDWCVSQGPILSPDPEVTKSGVGGVSIDLDRSQLGSAEDLLLVITYHALNELSSQNHWPANQAVDPILGPVPGTDHTQNDRTVLKVSLMATFENLASLMQAPQPRPWTYSNVSTYPIYLKEVATLQDPFGSMRTEQVYLPLSKLFLADRIRIDRIRGSYHLYQLDLYRLGNRSQ